MLEVLCEYMMVLQVSPTPWPPRGGAAGAPPPGRPPGSSTTPRSCGSGWWSSAPPPTRTPTGTSSPPVSFVLWFLLLSGLALLYSVLFRLGAAAADLLRQETGHREARWVLQLCDHLCPRGPVPGAVRQLHREDRTVGEVSCLHPRGSVPPHRVCG